MELEKALARITEIHAHVARGEIFRGYRAVPIAVTSLIAVAAASLQTFVWPAVDAKSFVLQWITAAGVCGVVCAWDFWLQGRFAEPRTLRQRTWPVVAQYLPALVVGGVVSFALVRTAHAPLLPGLWAMVHGLGIFASRPYLPRSVGWVTAWFFAAGSWLLIAGDVRAVVPDPWSVGLTFGIGQALLAAVLWANVERRGLDRREVER